MSNRHTAVALEGRLRDCRNVVTLGVKPNFSDYSEDEVELICSASKIYYPSSFYADLFDSIGKPTFPSRHNYGCAQDKIKQTALFEMARIPHPKTRVFYGPRQKSRIPEYFKFPFVAKTPRGSAMGRGVRLIRNPADLQQYLQTDHPAYIQEFLPVERDIRVVVIGRKIVLAYWRQAPPGDFKCNLAAGGRVRLDPVPPAALDLALSTARACQWNDVGIDILCYQERYLVLEGNMKYGKAGFQAAGIQYRQLMEELINDGEI